MREDVSSYLISYAHVIKQRRGYSPWHKAKKILPWEEKQENQTNLLSPGRERAGGPCRWEGN
jgi:hypothetical protein